MQEIVAPERVTAWTPDPRQHRIAFEPVAKRVRVVLGGETIADSTRARLMLESRYLPIYYFPRADVRTDLFEPSQLTTRCPHKGEARYWSVRAGGRLVENAAWGYPEPLEEAQALADYVAFYWDKMEHWYEEDEEVFVHPRDPYKRVDVIESRRPVRVVLAGETVAESARARFLFETGLPTRYYLPREDVRMDMLTPGSMRTRCPYKGEAHYWSARVGGKTYDDIVWSYPEPIAECPRIKDLLCFFNERVDEILVDGEPVPKVETKWST